MTGPALRRGRALLVLALLAAFYVVAEEIPTEPTITVVGFRDTGESVTCATASCVDSAQAESARLLMEWFRMYQEFPQEDLPLDGDKFCQALATHQPSGCSLDSPPASPGITVPGRSDFAPNGCGTGGVGGWFQNAVLSVITSNHYSGDIDAPYAGVSFRSVCDAHDICWAAGGARGACDDAFRDGTQAACAAVPDPQGTCSGFASLYHGAVSTTVPSDNAYEEREGQRKCALWARDMRENDCEDD